MTDTINVSTGPLQPPVPVVVNPPAKRSYSRIYGRNEVLDGEYKLYQKVLGELIGTALFVFGVCSCCVFWAGYPLITVIGPASMGGVIIYLFGRVSGAHFNPAVSLALFIREKLSGMEFGLYVLAQIIGSIIGCILFLDNQHICTFFFNYYFIRN